MTKINHRELARWFARKGWQAAKAGRKDLANTYFERKNMHSRMATNEELADEYTRGRKEAEADRKAADAARKRSARLLMKALNDPAFFEPAE